MHKRRLLALLLSVAMVVPSIQAYATVANDDVVIVETIENSEEAAEAVSEEVSQTLTSEEAVAETKEETVEATSEEVGETEEATSEELTSEEATSEELTSEEATSEEKIHELDASFELSDKQKAKKAALASSIAEIDEAKAGVDYVSDEVYYVTDNKGEAEAVAEAYGGELSEYDMGVATITLPKDVSVVEAVEFAADLTTNIPAIMPNYYAKAYGDFTEEIDEDSADNSDISEETGNIVDILEVTETVIEDEEIELEENVDKGFTDPYLQSASDKYQYQHNNMGSLYAWKAGYMGQGIKVAVIDTGVNNKTGELTIKNTYNAVNNTNDASDDQGHGTHCAGIVAAALDGKYGAGIAPKAEIYAIKVLKEDGTGTYDDIVRGVKKATEWDVDIISMSLGGLGRGDDYQEAINEAYNKGIAIFAASGNDGGQIDSFPACYDHVMSVASSNEIDGLSDFSNINKKVAFTGPGSRIWSIAYDSSDYVEKSGTSMACPAIAGAAAVLLSSGNLGSKSSARVDELRTLMSRNSKFVNGKAGAGIPYLPKCLDITTEGLKPDLPKIDTSLSEDFKTISVTITSDTFSNLVYTVDGKAPNLKVPVAGQKRVNSNTVSFTVPVSKNKHTINAIAVNESGLSSNVQSKSVGVRPTVAQINIAGITKLAAGKSAALKAEVLPVIATNKKLDWTIAPANQGVTIAKASGRITASNAATPGVYTVTAVAADNGGASRTYKIEVIAGEYIKSLAFSQKQEILNRGAADATKNISSYISGVSTNGSTISAADVVWSSNKPDIASVSQTGIVTAKSAGTAVITALANDGSGKKATISVKVNQLVSGINLNTNVTKLAAGKRLVLKPTLNPTKPTNQKLIWSVSPDNGGVKVVNGIITVTKSAANTNYTVTATAADGGGATASKTFSVISGGITKIAPNVKAETLFRVTDTYNTDVTEPTEKNIQVAVTGEAGADTDMISAVSSNTDIVTVSEPVKNGNSYDFTVKASGQLTGTAVITFSSTDGSNKVAKVNIKVINPASSLSIAGKNAEFAEQIIEGKTVKLAANLGTYYGVPGTKKIKWEIVSVQNGNKNKVNVNPSAGVVKVMKGVGHKAIIVVKATLQDGSGLSDQITLTTIEKESAVRKLCLVKNVRYSGRSYSGEAEETNKVTYIYLSEGYGPRFVGYAVNVARIYPVGRKSIALLNWVDPSCVHWACSSGNNDVATPMMVDDKLYVLPRKRGATSVIVADKVSGKFVKYRIVVQ